MVPRLLAWEVDGGLEADRGRWRGSTGGYEASESRESVEEVTTVQGCACLDIAGGDWGFSDEADPKLGRSHAVPDGRDAG
jgi:hypothetical protein